MNALLEQLGIDWKLFLSQAVNFFILLVILRAFVYKPLISIIEKRNKKIREGLEKAEEADIRLKEVDNISKEKIKDAQLESIGIIKNTEAQAKVLAVNLQKKAEERQEELLKQIEASHKKQQEEVKTAVLKEAANLVRKAIVKTVELNPDQIDEALIKKAVSQVKNEK
ncbi:MAG: ATP synthase F0 subunit B [Patescibacteria group bacterium]